MPRPNLSAEQARQQEDRGWLAQQKLRERWPTTDRRLSCPIGQSILSQQGLLPAYFPLYVEACTRVTSRQAAVPVDRQGIGLEQYRQRAKGRSQPTRRRLQQ